MQRETDDTLTGQDVPGAHKRVTEAGSGRKSPGVVGREAIHRLRHGASALKRGGDPMAALAARHAVPRTCFVGTHKRAPCSRARISVHARLFENL